MFGHRAARQSSGPGVRKLFGRLEADDLAEALRGVSASTHTHASGARISPVGTQAQVTRPVFRIERSLLFIVPPFWREQARPSQRLEGADWGSGTNHRLGRGES